MDNLEIPMLSPEDRVCLVSADIAGKWRPKKDYNHCNRPARYYGSLTDQKEQYRR